MRVNLIHACVIGLFVLNPIVSQPTFATLSNIQITNDDNNIYFSFNVSANFHPSSNQK